MPEARYDGAAAWYDRLAGEFTRPFARALASRAAGYAERGDVVLDVGCGTGLGFDALRARGLHPVGVDLSADQLAIARRRAAGVVRADAAALPMRDAAVRVVVAAFVHTDVDDFPSAVAEVARVLAAGGRFVYIGTHPCFVGRFIERRAQGERDVGEVGVRRGYGDPGVSFEGRRGTFGLSARVGSRNLAIEAVLGAVLAAGLRIESFEELDTRAQSWTADSEDRTLVPWNILLVAAKPRTRGAAA
jgi:SAM-dependent methyltransferase